MIIKNYLGGRMALMRGDIDVTGGSIKALLVKQGSSFMTDDEVEFLSDFSTLAEFASAGYARQTLAGNSLTADWDRDRAIFDADNPVWNDLDDDDAPIVGMIIFQHVGADSANIPLFGYQIEVPTDPGGEDYEFPFSSNGIAEL